MRKPLLCLAAALLVTACATAPSAPPPGAGRPMGGGDPLVRALEDPKRPEADVRRDDLRRPAEVLAFAGVRSGAKVADLIPGDGYYTRILSRAVGPTGKVYTYVPDELTKLANRKPAVAGIADDPAYGNVEMVLNTLPNFGAPEKLDAVLSVGTYHYHYTRLLGSPNVVAINRKVFELAEAGRRVPGRRRHGPGRHGGSGRREPEPHRPGHGPRRRGQGRLRVRGGKPGAAHHGRHLSQQCARP
ncbi:hypothetical protein ABOZ73_18305 [Caulobacter sp. 73W]|uniref:Uncharacterized protein n=1 Tax=Caulobacter sp. 73W TaxID=3161137 RepID=A0AB39KTR3_9CAUL